MKKPSVLLIYTGGTIGMMQDPKTGVLKPFNFKALTKQIPELQKFDIILSSISFEKPIDSSNMSPETWIELAEIIKSNYDLYNGFVILHGSDTMAFTASALSFMLQNLGKPVILTGSQLPIGMIRTDGKENLITAIEIAAAQKNNKPIVKEVCVYFEYKLHRGNRTLKYNSAHFDAFKSPNYPALAEAGVNIDYKTNYFLKPSKKQFSIQTQLDNDVVVLKLFPGLSKKITLAILNIPEIKGVIIETFGAGNASTQPWFIDALKTAINKGIIIYNVTQCPEGKVIQGMYETSSHLKRIGVISGQDITFESAIAKLMFVLGQKLSLEKSKKLLETNLVGEISE